MWCGVVVPAVQRLRHGAKASERAAVGVRGGGAEGAWDHRRGLGLGFLGFVKVLGFSSWGECWGCRVR